MAAKVLNVFKQIKISSCARSFQTTSLRQSRYSVVYLDPTPSKEELAEGLEDDDPRKYQPIKAANPDQTSSLNYDPLIAKFTRQLISEGEKRRAHRIVSRTFEQMKLIQLGKYNKAQTDAQKQLIELDTKKIFHQAVENLKPLLITQRVKKGDVLYTVPISVRPAYATFKAMKWLIDAASEKEETVRVWDKLGYEIIEASNNEGRAIRRKQDLHRLCEANRAYAHYRW